MTVVLATIFSFLSSIAWLQFIRWIDRIKSEPWPVLIKLFGFGILFGLIAGTLNDIVLYIYGENTLLLFSGINEEAIKFLAFYLVIRKSIDFDDPLDGVVFGGTVALGFSFLENIFYLYYYFSEGTTNEALVAVLARAVTSFLHIVFSSIWGMAYYFSYKRIKSRWYFAPFLLASMLIHSGYNMLAYESDLMLIVGSAFGAFLMYTIVKKVTTKLKAAS